MGRSLRGLLHSIAGMHASHRLPQAADDRARLVMLRRFYEQSGVSLVAAGLLIVVPLADDRGLQWRLRPTPPWVHGDEVQLKRMLRTLHSNALNHGARRGVLLALFTAASCLTPIVATTSS
jgi:signal transduction histidine kinase